jgi:hypothetical protein
MSYLDAGKDHTFCQGRESEKKELRNWRLTTLPLPLHPFEPCLHFPDASFFVSPISNEHLHDMILLILLLDPKELTEPVHCVH